MENLNLCITLLIVASGISTIQAQALLPTVASLNCTGAPADSCCNFIKKGLLPSNNSQQWNKTTPQLLDLFNISYKTYTVESKGYILTLFRVFNNATKGPVYLNHGLMAESVDWFINDLATGKTVVQVLINAGYDVWIANARGTKYSSNTTITMDTNTYWNFTWNELGKDDVLAVMQFILKETEYRKLAYIGHSMGGTQYYVRMSQPPAADGTNSNDMVSIGVLLCPAGFMQNVGGPLGFAGRNFGDFVSWLGVGPVSIPPAIEGNLLAPLCSSGSGSYLCANGAFILMGFNYNNTNCSQIAFALGHFPNPTPARSIMHYAQEVASGKFREYDTRFYGSLFDSFINVGKIPANYKLSLITAPTAIFWGGQDYLADPKDVNYTISQMNNETIVYKKYIPSYMHLDPIMGMDAYDVVYVKILELLEQYPPER